MTKLFQILRAFINWFLIHRLLAKKNNDDAGVFNLVLFNFQFIVFLQLLINLRIQADILKALRKSNLCSIKSKSP